MMPASNPPPTSKEPTTPQKTTPVLPAPAPEKKTGKKLETPILVAIISAGVTLITALLSSPVLLSLVNKTNTSASLAAAPTDTSYATATVELTNTPIILLPTDLPPGDPGEATSAPVENVAPTSTGIEVPEVTATLPGKDSSPTLPPPVPTSTSAPPPPTEGPPTPATAASSLFQCIATDMWFLYPTSLQPGSKDGCWDLDEWGFAAEQGLLNLVHNPGYDQERGIYIPISGDVDIRFSIQLNKFRTRLNKLGFLNFGVVLNDPISIYTGGYLSYEQSSPGAGSPVHVIVSGSNQATQKISDLKAGFQHEVFISIRGDRMTVYLNGEQAGKPVNLPAAKRAFWIGYVLPSGTELDGIVSGFTIQTP